MMTTRSGPISAGDFLATQVLFRPWRASTAFRTRFHRKQDL